MWSLVRRQATVPGSGLADRGTSRVGRGVRLKAFFHVLTLLLRDWRVLFLALLLVGLVAATIGLRARPSALSAAGDSQVFVALLGGPVTADRLAPFVPYIFADYSATHPGSLVSSALFASTVGPPLLGLNTGTLDGIVFLLFPLVALLIGATFLPERRSEAMLFSLPVRRSLLFLMLAGALTLFIAGVMSVAFSVSLGLGAVLGAPDPTLVGTAARFWLASTLYVLFFALLGLALSIALRTRESALVAGVIAVVLLAGVGPSAYDLLVVRYGHFIMSQVKSTSELATFRPRPTVLGTTVSLLGVAPTCALAAAYQEVASLRSPLGCRTCGDTTGTRRALTRNYRVLGVAILLPLIVGMALFSRKEASGFG
jgi:ABC-type transport system involved in multi-copper enzyme maturation permease subunit